MRGKGAPPVVSLTYFLNKFAAAPFQPPRMVIFHFTKVTRSENCGQLGRRALNWGRRLPAVSELLIKTQTASLQSIKLFAHFAMHGLFGGKCIFFPISLFGGAGGFFDSFVVSLDVKKAVVFLEKRWRQQWVIRMQIYAAYNATL